MFCGLSRSRTPLAVRQVLLFFCAMQHSASEDESQHPVAVSFEQVDRSELLEKEQSRFLFHHHQCDLFPAVADVSMREGDVAQLELQFHDGVSKRFNRWLLFEAKRQQSFVVTQMFS